MYILPLFGIVGMLLFFCLNGCKPGSAGSELSEGIIEYKAVVIDEAHPLADLAPGNMTLKFKDDKYVAEMSTMGFFTTRFLLDIKQKRMTQMVKVLDVKDACIDDEKALLAESETYKLNFKETGETKVIAGYKCKKLIASKVNDPADKFDVYYTEELQVESPNFANPYAHIKGMLMEYRLKKFGLEMKFTAKSVKAEDIPDSEFELPAYYRIVTRQEMDDFFKNFE